MTDSHGPDLDEVLSNGAKKAGFFPVNSLANKRNFKRWLRIERDGSVNFRVFLDVPDRSLRELIVCKHYLRHIVRHFLKTDVGVNIIGRDDPWDFRVGLSTGEAIGIEIIAIADNETHFKINKREERLTKWSRTKTIPLHQLRKLNDLFTDRSIGVAIAAHCAAGGSESDLVPNPLFHETMRIIVSAVPAPRDPLERQIQKAVLSKMAKPHTGKDATVLSHSDASTHRRERPHAVEKPISIAI
jgi:hypothetical protein